MNPLAELSLSVLLYYYISAFVWTAGGTEDTFDHNVGGVPGISVTFLIRATSSAFVHISEMRIIAHPYT